MISKLLVSIFIGEVKVTGSFSGQCIYVTNHPRELDVFLINYVFPDAHIMGAESVIKNIGWLLPKDKCFSAKDGIATSLRLLEQGNSIAICPAGWTELTGNDLPWKKGALVISNKAGVPIVPVKLSYSSYRGEWINSLPTVLQWVVNLLLPRKRGVEVLIKEERRGLEISDKSAQELRAYTIR